MKPIIIKSHRLPKRVTGMALFPFILIRPGHGSPTLLRHEQIHIQQQLELLVIPFYLLYLMEYLIKCMLKRGNAYRDISFEQEAFAMQNQTKRKLFGWVPYVFRMQ